MFGAEVLSSDFPNFAMIVFFFLSLSFRMYLVGCPRAMLPVGWARRYVFPRMNCLLPSKGFPILLAFFPSTNFFTLRLLFSFHGATLQIVPPDVLFVGSLQTYLNRDWVAPARGRFAL